MDGLTLTMIVFLFFLVFSRVDFLCESSIGDALILSLIGFFFIRVEEFVIFIEEEFDVMRSSSMLCVV